MAIGSTLPFPVAGDGGAVLTADERERAARFCFKQDAARWVAARSFVRRTLGKVLAMRPEDVVFDVSRAGKPKLAGVHRGLGCNWSHAGDWVALAWVNGVEVGIDLEVIRPDFPVVEVADRFFTAGECAALGRVAGKARQVLFFQLWTAKEALMKAVGLGLGLPPEEIDCVIADGGPCAYRSHPDWRLHRHSYTEAGMEVAVAAPAEVSPAVRWPEIQAGAAPGERASVLVA